MGLSATLNGTRVLDARLSIPGWGASYHDVTLEGEVSLTGAVTLLVSDLTIKGTILTGGVGQGRSFYRIVAGAGGWPKSLPKKSYANDAGVKLATVIGDAAAAAGETLDATTVDQQARLGPAFARVDGEPAARVLEQLAPSAWYVGEDGKTRLGARAPTTFTTKLSQISQLDLARGTVTIASDTIAALLPGVSVAGLNAIDVEHTYSVQDGLRTRIWGRQAGATSRRLRALRAIVDQLDPDRKFRGLYEYRIVTQSGERLNLQAVRVSTGMPDLQRVYVRPGLPGCKAQHKLGARVLVGFVNADPTFPVVLSYEDAEGGGFLPTLLELAGGGSALGRVGDEITITQAQLNTAGAAAGSSAVTLANPAGLKGTITSGSSKVTSG